MKGFKNMSNDNLSVQPLKPCPFCGRKGRVTSRLNEAKTIEYFFIRCRGCGARTGRHKDADYAKKAWNRRAGESNE